MVVILGWTLVWGVVWGLVCGIVAANRGRSGIGWFFLGFFFSFIAVIVLALIPALNTTPQQIIVQLQGTPGIVPNDPAIENQLGDRKTQGGSKAGVWVLAVFASMIALGMLMSGKDRKPEREVVTHTAVPVSAPAPAASWADGSPPPTDPAPPEPSQVRPPAAAATSPAKQRQPAKRNLQIIIE
ncbi:hypothetical protein [Methylocystis parvus]|uniref:hypothetical protein n=1 Tax=Methylocystis parvus TaxID=134 RepID=UPI003C768406